ncbi:hypothetical protein HTX81_00700 [Pseudomonas lini]|uniref:hypothetical protein n=1 Tax=Pseudomonas lini TaxID=163011 RepID=UPI000578EACC|nr:hypothetical protein [Pseudomonas lini]NSX07095.1 hypothetical protein [Pseudomonas lini]
MFFVKLLAFVAFFASVVWFWADPDYEPGIAIVTSFSTLIGIWISERQSRNKPSQTQTVGVGGVAVQAGGDAHIGSISNGDAKDAQ